MTSRDAAGSTTRLSWFEQLSQAREIIRFEGQSLLDLAGKLDQRFCEAVHLLYECRGNVIVSGMGKAGLVGQKIAGTLASTGTRSHFLHPGEALHGDLGRVHRDDTVLMLSLSGESDEVVQLLPSLDHIQVPVIAITGRPESTLGRFARVTIDLGSLEEAGMLGLAPTTSTTAMLAVGDALALVTSQMHQFNAEDFARVHPGGSLGRQLAKVEDIMRPVSECRIANQLKTVRRVLVESGRPGRRSGAILLTDDDGRLVGIFTDSDLARLLEGQLDESLDAPIQHVMTSCPTTVVAGSMMKEALSTLASRRISELPVIDNPGRPVGLIDITDVLGLIPAENLIAQSGQPITSDNSVTDQPCTVLFPNQPGA